MRKVLFIDIDGTLSADGSHSWGDPVLERIKKVNQLFASGYTIYLWSARGANYARAFADKHRISATGFLSKPGYMVDDNPDIRPPDRFKIIGPDQIFSLE